MVIVRQFALDIVRNDQPLKGKPGTLALVFITVVEIILWRKSPTSYNTERLPSRWLMYILIRGAYDAMKRVGATGTATVSQTL